MNRFAILLALFLGALIVIGGYGLANRPMVVTGGVEGKLPSVSFAPFRDGQGPTLQIYPGREEVIEDVAHAAKVARGLRTYTVQEGIEHVPNEARKHGLDLTLGGWLTSEVEAKGKKMNVEEMAALIKMANQNPDNVKRLIVGNEVLLRGDLTAAQLIQYIRQVKASVKQPVSYADVWVFFLKYPEVAKEVDFLTIHILPYWEDEPIAADKAPDHILNILKEVKQAFPDKPILIGEVGWPTEGRTRGPAEAGIVNTARLIREVAALSQQHGFDFNWIEAFDQEWKAKLEGTVGGHWGMLDHLRNPKFPLVGPVVENAHWPIHATVAALIGLALSLTVFWQREKIPASQISVKLILCLGIGVALVESWRFGVVTIYSVTTLLPFVGMIALLVIAIPGILARTEAEDTWKAERFFMVQGVFSALAILFGLLLAFDGRYRDIPTTYFLVPAWGGLLVALWRKHQNLPRDVVMTANWTRFWHYTLLVTAGLVVIGEGLALRGQDFQKMHPEIADQIKLMTVGAFANPQILWFSATLLALAWFWRVETNPKRPQQTHDVVTRPD